MKKLLLYLFSAAALLLGCCSDDKELDDSHFVAFELNVNNTTYTASIADNTITITAPKDVDLTHAKVTYQLSEKATVIPDPTTIEDWSQDQAFRVQSQSGEYVSYRYTTSRSDVLEANSVMLTTQADVDNFAKKNINHIQGNLIIGSPAATSDSIKNLDGLKSVTHVDYNVVVNSSYAGSNLAGLTNLKYANGLYIGSENSSVSFSKKLAVELPALTESSNIVVHSDSVYSVFLPTLTASNNIYINSIELNNLDLTSYAQCYGNFTLEGMSSNDYSSAHSNLVLATLSLPALKQVNGTLLIENFWNISKFSMPQLEEVDGDLQLKYVRGTKKIALPALTTVKNNTNIQANDGMTSFAAPLLASTKSLNISSFNQYSINLKTIDLSALTSVTTTLTVQYGGFTDLSLPKLQTVGSKLMLNVDDYMETLSLPELLKCPNITIQSCSSLGSLALDKLTTLSTLQLTNTTVLSDLSLKSLESMDNLTMQYDIMFTTFSAPKLTTITSALTLYGGRNASQTAATVLTNLDGFTSLTKVGRVAITNFSSLTDFTGLKNVIPQLAASSWSVRGCKYNPTYQNMVGGKYKAE